MLSWTWEVLASATGISPQGFIHPLVRPCLALCVYAVRGYGMDLATVWLCLPCALSEDAPTWIEYHSPPLYHPQPIQNLCAPGASCQLLGRLRYTASLSLQSHFRTYLAWVPVAG